MSDLTSFRDHCRSMAADGAHLAACLSLRPRVSAWAARFADQEPFEPPACPGCVPAADRALFQRLADEVDAYLTEDEDEVLFG